MLAIIFYRVRQNNPIIYALFRYILMRESGMVVVVDDDEVGSDKHQQLESDRLTRRSYLI